MFLVDTGCEYSVAFGPDELRVAPDPSWRFSERGGKFEVGEKTVTMISNIPIAAFGRKRESSRLILLDRPGTSKAWSYFDGCLGFPDIEDLVVRIDLKNQVIASLDVPWQRPEGAIRTVPRIGPGNKAFLKVQVPTIPNVELMIDTGNDNFMSAISDALRFHVDRGEAIRANRILRTSGSGLNEVQTYILKSIKIGEFEFLDVPVTESNFNSLGMGCFSHFNMILDFPKNEVWLAPHSNEWPKRVPPDASGLVLIYSDSNVLELLRMQPDSAGSKSELKVDDQILLFDGKEPKDLSMREIHERLTHAGTTLPLRIRRGEQEFDVNLPLSYSFDYPPKWPEKKNGF